MAKIGCSEIENTVKINTHKTQTNKVELKYTKSKIYEKQAHAVQSSSSDLSLDLKVLKEMNPFSLISLIIQHIPD